jgi:acetylornithine deacetylase
MHVRLLNILLALTSCSGLQTPLGSGFNPTSKNNTELLRLHQKLVEISSVTGAEEKVGDWLASYLESHGLTVEKQKLPNGRFNVLAYPGEERSTKILLSSHIDTVPPFLPYSLNGTRIWGRGSVDAKACVAAQTIAALRIIDSATAVKSKAPSLSLLFVVGEEKGGDGMLYFSSHPPANYSAVIFGEPTEGRLATGHKGMLSFTLVITGKAAHSGYPWLGIDANDYLVDAVQTLRQLEAQLPRSEKLGPTTLNVGRIEGGVASNVVAETSTAEVAIRVAAGSPDQIKVLIHNALEPIKARLEEKGGSFELRYSNRPYGPVIIDTDIPGFDTIGVNYGTDIPNLSGRHKRYLYGPGSILVAHGPQEHLEISELTEAVDSYEKIARHLLEI